MWVTWRQARGSEVSDGSALGGSCLQHSWGLPAAATRPMGRILRRGWAPPGWAHQWPCVNLPKVRPVCLQNKSLNNQFAESLKKFCFHISPCLCLGCLPPPAHPSQAGVYANDGREEGQDRDDILTTALWHLGHGGFCDLASGELAVRRTGHLILSCGELTLEI